MAADAIPSGWLTVLTTEHYNLQTQRAATITETNGRASIFLGAVSAGLIALGFSLQSGPPSPGIVAFGVAILAVLTFLGAVTFFRTVQTSIDDVAYAARIEILRDAYQELLPDVAPILLRARGQDTYLSAVRKGLWQRFITVSASLAVVTSVLGGATLGLLLFGLLSNLVASLTVAVTVSIASIVLLMLVQRREWLASQVLA